MMAASLPCPARFGARILRRRGKDQALMCGIAIRMIPVSCRKPQVLAIGPETGTRAGAILPHPHPRDTKGWTSPAGFMSLFQCYEHSIPVITTHGFRTARACLPPRHLRGFGGVAQLPRSRIAGGAATLSGWLLLSVSCTVAESMVAAGPACVAARRPWAAGAGSPEGQENGAGGAAGRLECKSRMIFPGRT